MRRRAVVTGIGVASALGLGREEFFAGLRDGRSGIDRLSLFDTTGYRTHLAGQVWDYRPEEHFTRRRLKRLSRCDQLGLVAAREAAADAQLAECGAPAERIACVLGAGAGGMLAAETFREAYVRRGPKAAMPSLLTAFPSAATCDQVAAELGLAGPRTTVVTACSSSATAIGLALDLIRQGRADLAVTGGSDALARLTYSGFNALRAVDPDPCRPFDRDRKGLNLGEAGAILVIEEAEHARARGAHIYAELLGYATTCDAYHMTAPDTGGEGARRAILAALADAGRAPAEVDYVNAHGTATVHNDAVESQAIRGALGGRAGAIPVSSIKSMIGHCLGAAGCIEIAATVLAIERDLVPPTVNFEHPGAGCDLDYVPGAARRQRLRTAISNSFAFGGNNTCVVLGRWEEPA